MIRRPRADFGGHLRSPAEPELVGMDSRLQPRALPGLENLAGLLGREDAVLAEHVAPFREAVAYDGRNHLADDRIDVLPPRGAMFGRDLVRAEKRRGDVDGMGGVERPRRAE